MVLAQQIKENHKQVFLRCIGFAVGNILAARITKSTNMKTYYFTLALLLSCSPFLTAQEFVNAVQIPPLIQQDDYHLNVIETAHNFDPNGTSSLNSMIPTFAFEDANNPGSTTILGPTLTWSYLHDLTPKVTNYLSEVTTCHWHGAHVPQFADGGPHQRIMPDQEWTPYFKVLDKSATMWYHPHAMDLTYRHVQMGLSGMILVEDPIDNLDDPILSELHDILPNEYEVNDFPLIFQTKKFVQDTTSGDWSILANTGFKDGYEYMVNGIIDPYIELPAGMVRLRLLNGDGKFSFNFKFENANGSEFPAHMIATDAGYMDRSYQLDGVLMAPGERTEWLLDLRGLPPGFEIFIKNEVTTIGDGIIGNAKTTNNYAQDRNLLKIIVGSDSGPQSPIISFPINLLPLENPPLSSVTNERVKTFRQDSFLVDGKMHFLFNIDSVLMDMMVVNDVVNLGATEVWTIENDTKIAHPWHIHDIHFWVIEIEDEKGDLLDPNDFPTLFKGPKDNVLVEPGWKLSYITTFDDFGTEIKFDSSYMFHCHILPHEDRGMMGQFVVWNGFGDPSSVEDQSNTPLMRIYPNPSNDYFIIEGASQKSSNLFIMDISGQIVQTLRLPRFDGFLKINSVELPNGLHLLKWQTEEGFITSKIMIQH